MVAQGAPTSCAFASMAKLVNAGDSKSSAVRLIGSIPIRSIYAVCMQGCINVTQRREAACLTSVRETRCLFWSGNQDHRFNLHTRLDNKAVMCGLRLV